MAKCSGCLCKIPDGASECPRCGCPVDLSDYLMDNSIDKIRQKEKKRKMLVGLSIVVIVLCIFILAGLVIWNENEKKRARAEMIKEMAIETDQIMDDYNKNMDMLMDELEEDRRKFEEEQRNK